MEDLRFKQLNCQLFILHPKTFQASDDVGRSSVVFQVCFVSLGRREQKEKGIRVVQTILKPVFFVAFAGGATKKFSNRTYATRKNFYCRGGEGKNFSINAFSNRIICNVEKMAFRF